MINFCLFLCLFMYFYVFENSCSVRISFSGKNYFYAITVLSTDGNVAETMKSVQKLMEHEMKHKNITSNML